MSVEEFRQKAGFDVDNTIRAMKNDLGLGMVRVTFDQNIPRAYAVYNGSIPEAHLPPLEVIVSQTGLSEEEARAKIKSEIAEEFCHLANHETNHNEKVVSCTIGEMEKHMTREELNFPYIQQKVQRLKSAQDVIQGQEL